MNQPAAPTEPMVDGDSAMQSAPPAAALWRQLVAMLYDALLIIPLVMAATAGLLVLHKSTGNSEAIPPPWQVQLLSVLVLTGFYAIFWRKSGQTLGMQAWRIKLVTAEGQVPRGRHIIKRLIGVLVSLLPAGLGYWWSLWDRQHQSWHDKLSGTRLIRVPAKTEGTD